MYDPIDFRQAYLEVSHEGWVSGTLCAGRQEIVMGAGRLIGNGDWGIGKTYDSLDLTLSRGNAKFVLLAGSPVLIVPTRLDQHKPGEHFYGVYGSIRNPLPSMTVEPYLLFKQNLAVTGEKGGIGDALIVAPGGRVAGNAPGRIDYSAEVVIERGSYSADRASAIGGTYIAGWTLNDSKLKPRISAQFSHASGDSNSKDGLRGTFDSFYASIHDYTSMTDQMGWKNMRGAKAAYDMSATGKLKFRAGFSELYLASTQDGLYNSSGTRIVLNRAATSRHVGSELGVQASYAFSKIFKASAGLSHLYAGQYLIQSKGSYGYNYPWVGFIGTF